MLKLPKPSKLKRREMGKVKRPDAVNSARRVGRADAIKKRCVCVRLLCATRPRCGGKTSVVDEGTRCVGMDS